MQRTALLSLLIASALILATACSGGGGGNNNGGGLAGFIGMVSSAAGGALDEYVTLTFTPMGGGMPVTTMTDAAGAYTVNLAPDTYSRLTQRPGYVDETTQGLVVMAGAPTVEDVTLAPMPAGEYIGSEDCGVCHAATYDTFSRSGHPFKITKVINNQEPTFPFTSIAGALGMIFDDDTDPMDPKAGTDNTLGTPTSWADVPYLIGGWGWKCRFIDQDGYIVTGSEVQYNHFTGAMASYHDNETDKPFNCGNCHTTGWRHTDVVLNNARQDNKPGMDGTWAEEGIGCEACHGAGSTHSQTLLAGDITEDAGPRTTAQMLGADQGYGLPIDCGECHTRDGERDYPTYASAFDNARIAAGQPILPQNGRVAASGGLIKHHEQGDEILGINPDDPNLASTRTPAFMGTHGDCGSCHDPHTTTHFQDVSGDPPGVRTSCTTCHPTKVITSGGMQGLSCQDCHMPLLAKSAVKTFDPPPGDDRPALGDIRSHIFRIDLTKADTEQFSGSFAKEYITGRWACQSCHSVSGPSFPISFPSGMTIHN